MNDPKDALPAAQPGPLVMPDDEVLYELADLFRVFGDSSRIKILYAGHRECGAAEPVCGEPPAPGAEGLEARAVPPGRKDRLLRTGR